MWRGCCGFYLLVLVLTRVQDVFHALLAGDYDSSRLLGFYKVGEKFDLEWYRSTHFNSSMISMKNILKRLIVLSEDMIEEEVVKCLLPQLMLMGNSYSATLPSFVPEVSMKSTLVKVLVLVTGCSL